MNTSLVVFVTILALGAAQMTFSDGWEKRSGRAYHYPHQKVARSGGHSFHESEEAAEALKNTPATPITNCMEEYMAGVREMHAAMMELYSRFQSCENVQANPLLPSSRETTSRF